ncbi:MAG: ABC transporter substrate-binding protein [Nocardioides sp.]|uniref:ABC transporter substrate-binding protein n=1 Tax=Nocardioides sp. TaxID=35761 RepID=UPI0039E5871A
MFRRVAGSAALVLAASAALAACGGSESSGESDGGASASTDPIVIGAYGPLTGPAASLKVLYDAIGAYYDDLNAKGGIDGHPVTFVTEDDQLNPAQTPAAARTLVERDKVSMICGPAGSPTTVAVKPYLEAHDIGIVPAAGSDELIGKTSFLQVPTYTPLAADLVKYAVEDLHATKIAIAYTDDSVGQPTLAGATGELEELGLEPVATVSFNGTAPDQSALVAKLKQSGADFVVVNNTAPVISQVFKAAAKIGYEPTWGAAWPALTKTLFDLSGGALDSGNIVFSSPFLLGDAPEAKDFQDVLTKYAPDVDQTDTIAMLGWTSASVCTEVLRRAVEAADGGVPTSKEIVAAMPGTTVDNGYVNGLSWSADQHSGQRQARIIGVKDGQFVALTDLRELPDVAAGK